MKATVLNRVQKEDSTLDTTHGIITSELVDMGWEVETLALQRPYLR